MANLAITQTMAFIRRLLEFLVALVVSIPELLAVALMACVWGGIVYGLADLILR